MARYTYHTAPWDDLPRVPMIDATEPLELGIVYTDAKFAEPRNPENCAIARSAKRTFNSEIVGVKIGAQTALVHYDTYILRYYLSAGTKAMVKAYDKAGFFCYGVTVKLIPPPPKGRLGARVGEKKGGPHNGNGKPDIRSSKTQWLRHVNQPSAA